MMMALTSLAGRSILKRASAKKVPSETAVMVTDLLYLLFKAHSLLNMRLSALKPKLVTQDSSSSYDCPAGSTQIDKDNEGKPLALALCHETVSTLQEDDAESLCSSAVSNAEFSEPEPSQIQIAGLFLPFLVPNFGGPCCPRRVETSL
eukprot:scaffold40226_cov94-Skeletonema_dohrnii-CCMP3373.AAC.2